MGSTGPGWSSLPQPSCSFCFSLCSPTPGPLLVPVSLSLSLGSSSPHTWQTSTHPSDLRGNVTSLEDPPPWSLPQGLPLPYPWHPLVSLTQGPRCIATAAAGVACAPPGPLYRDEPGAQVLCHLLMALSCPSLENHSGPKWLRGWTSPLGRVAVVTGWLLRVQQPSPRRQVGQLTFPSPGSGQLAVGWTHLGPSAPPLLLLLPCPQPPSEPGAHESLLQALLLGTHTVERLSPEPLD